MKYEIFQKLFLTLFQKKGLTVNMGGDDKTCVVSIFQNLGCMFEF